MIRYSALTLAVVFLLAYAWRDWFKSLCAVIAFVAMIERRDMPRSLFGIPGLNVWNLMLANVLLAWLVARRRERRAWDLPIHVNLLMLCYLVVIGIASARMIADPVHPASLPILFMAYVVDTFKWTVPGLLLYDGCRSRDRFKLGLAATCSLYVALALQVARQIPPALDMAELERKSREVLEQMVGYHRVDLSVMLAGASWAIFASRGLVRPGWQRWGLLATAVAVAYGQALTAGRAGYVAWAVVGLVMLSLRWRGYLLLAPAAILAINFALPSVTQRMLEGLVAEDEPLVEEAIDENKLTAGRSRIWPVVIAKIREKPLHGFGRFAMRRTGTSYALADPFGHPHNAYLELLFDAGILGFVPIMAWFLVALFHSLRLLGDDRSPVFAAAGGTCLALVLAWMVGAVGAQTFYPRQSNAGMWCAAGLMFRVSVERGRALARMRRRRAGSVALADARQVIVPTQEQPSGTRRAGPRQAARSRVASLDGRLWGGDSAGPAPETLRSRS